MSEKLAAPQWRPKPLIGNPWLRYGLLVAALAYGVIAYLTVDVDLERMWRGLPRTWLFIKGFIFPDFTSRSRDIVEGIVESLSITVVSTAIGIVLSVGFGFGAARNIVPLPVYLLCRAVVALSRSFHEIIVALFFVALFGFGPFAGMLTLAFGSIGFISKLLAEEIEAMDMAPVEAMRATGAGWFQIMIWAVLPQVGPRLVGLSLYRFDINFRESAIIGVVGAGGIGGTLRTSIARYEYDTSSAILLIIIGIVFFCEVTSGYIRRRLL